MNDSLITRAERRARSSEINFHTGIELYTTLRQCCRQAATTDDLGEFCVALGDLLYAIGDHYESGPNTVFPGGASLHEMGLNIGCAGYHIGSHGI